ncbi:hypothetical protein POPTR_012G048550v4 [Populus trichocarpa]|uniref:Uncharacterized protein n=1 Tax=Populus trichocarpa TaxID=3694 RepID=A0ACC0S4N3_POPTR|nr:hypothetical protein POPTR_012G048550v4 [Populus trichocarpa]
MASYQDHGVELPQIQEEAPHVEGWEQEIQKEKRPWDPYSHVSGRCFTQ